MIEKTARNCLHCDGKNCPAPIIPVGGGYAVTGNGEIFCMHCAEGPTLETQSDVAGAHQ